MDYNRYIKSEKWAKRKADYYSTHRRACAVADCSTSAILHLHHITYDRLGHEHDDDLIPLCEFHHALVHNIEKSQGVKLRTATEMVTETATTRPKRKKRPRYSYADPNESGISKTERKRRQKGVAMQRRKRCVDCNKLINKKSTRCVRCSQKKR